MVEPLLLNQGLSRPNWRDFDLNPDILTASTSGLDLSTVNLTCGIIGAVGSIVSGVLNWLAQGELMEAQLKSQRILNDAAINSARDRLDGDIKRNNTLKTAEHEAACIQGEGIERVKKISQDANEKKKELATLEAKRNKLLAVVIASKQRTSYKIN